MCEYGLNRSGSMYGLMADCCEYGGEFLGSLKGDRFLNETKDRQHVKKNSVACSKSFTVRLAMVC